MFCFAFSMMIQRQRLQRVVLLVPIFLRLLFCLSSKHNGHSSFVKSRASKRAGRPNRHQFDKLDRCASERTADRLENLQKKDHSQYYRSPLHCIPIFQGVFLIFKILVFLWNAQEIVLNKRRKHPRIYSRAILADVKSFLTCR